MGEPIHNDHSRFRAIIAIVKYLDEHFNPEHPNTVWCTDITYIWTIDGLVYLTICIESFHSLLKSGCLHRVKIRDYAHAYRFVFEYIETFYNTVRSPSDCNYLSQNEYERKYRFAN
jgi:transposase InsO family protein